MPTARRATPRCCCLVGGEQRLLAHQRDLLAQPPELGVDQLAAALGVGMRRAARRDDFDLLLEAAAQLVVRCRAAEALAAAPLLLLELAALALGDVDHFGRTKRAPPAA